VTALTGMNVYAAVFLIPLGVCVYVVLGGLRATFLCKFFENTAAAIPRLITFDRRLYSHFYPHDHHSLLHVLRLHLKRLNRLAYRNVRLIG
jgi:hypothetical protein